LAAIDKSAVAKSSVAKSPIAKSPVDVALEIRKDLAEFQRTLTPQAYRAALRAACEAALLTMRDGPDPFGSALSGPGGTTSGEFLEPSKLFMLASNPGGGKRVWQYQGSGSDWTPVTETTTNPESIAAVGGTLYVKARNGNGPFQVRSFSIPLFGNSAWTPVTGANTSVQSIAAVGDVLCMLAANSGEGSGVWQYGLSGNSWIPLTSPAFKVEGISVSNNNLYMIAHTIGSSELGKWEYSGTPGLWTPAS
jgi:hypothetical protein